MKQKTRSGRSGNLQKAIVAAKAVLAGVLLLADNASAWRVDWHGTSGQAASTSAGVALDSGGNIVVAGYLGNLGTGLDFAVGRFSALTGEELWSHQISGAYTPGGDFASAVAVDAADNVIAAGSVLETTSAIDMVVVKLSSTGTLLWRSDIDSVGGVDDYGRAVTLDSSGNVMVAGKLDNEFAVVKLAAATGAEIWRRQVNNVGPGGYGVATAIAVDGAGNVIAGGGVSHGTGDVDYDFAVVKLSGAAGTVLWQHTYDGADPMYGFDFANDLTVTATGDVVAVGSVAREFVVTKFHTATGAEIWRSDFGGVFSDAAYAVALASDGDVFAGGDLDLVGASEFTVMRLDGASGSTLWAQELPGVGGRVDDLVVTPAGDVVAGGWLYEELLLRRRGAIVASNGTTGAEIWRQEFTGPLYYLSAPVNRLAIAGDGSIGVAGTVDTRAGVTRGVVARLNSAGGSVVLGKSIVVKDRAGAPQARRIVAVLRDDHVTVPAPSSENDPTLGAGAVFTLTNPGTGETAAFTLPGGSWWTGLGNPPGSSGYVYRDPGGANGPCRVVVARHARRLKAVCTGANGTLPFSLDEAAQGSLNVSLQFGSYARQCANFGGAIALDAGTTNPGPAGTFRATNAPITDDCPVP